LRSPLNVVVFLGQQLATNRAGRKNTMLLKLLQRKWGAIRARSQNETGAKLWRKGRLPAAEKAFRLAIESNASYAPAYGNLGSVLLDMHCYDEGFAMLQKAAWIAPRHAGILVNLGNAFAMSGRLTQAIRTYQEALTIDGANTEALLNLTRPLMETCDWQGLARHLARIKACRPGGQPDDWLSLISPFNSFFLPFTRQEQLMIARRAAADLTKAIPKSRNRPRPLSRVPDDKRLRIGYLSSDFHDHATSHLTLGIYSQHDRNQFEIYAYSIGSPDDSHYRRKIVADCDHFAEVQNKSADEIANLITSDGIDILVDLKGYCGGSRPEILALRPANIQVNYLGYPGTMGASFIDYIVADHIVIPSEHEADYSERVVRLPNTYQATDDLQAVTEINVTRVAAGLPESNFVFCCFNTPAKIDQRSFACWMEILAQVPHSVLWLLETTPEVAHNLAAAAQSARIDRDRIIFSPRLPKAEHLSRLRLADLMLDTFCCNAHTTATDALWVGLPLITLTGETFSSRVATSLLHAAGLPELAMRSETDFIQQAIDLANNPHRLQALRQQLNTNKRHTLFNTRKFVRDLEDVYLEMYRREQGAAG
jgi:predicted O-linked N-acetylglucosamine transferase (SPINDLY family)